MSTQTLERMVVEIDGQGDALVMIHGLGGTSNTFTPALPLLASRLRVIRPDLPGSGRSPLGSTVSIPALADAIVRMLGALGIERAHVSGHSLGTIVCFHLAVRHPSLVRSLALFGPLVQPADSARPGIRSRASAVRADGMQPTADQVVQGSLAAETRLRRPVAVALVREMLMRQDPEGYARMCEALAAATSADVGLVRCPTLLVTGDEDPIAPPTSVRAIAARIGGTRVVVLSRCGHWATLEKPDEVESALRDFYFGRAMIPATADASRARPVARVR